MKTDFWDQGTIEDSPLTHREHLYYLLNGLIWKPYQDNFIQIAHVDSIQPQTSFKFENSHPVETRESGIGFLQGLTSLDIHLLELFLPRKDHRLGWIWVESPHSFEIALADIPDTRDKETWIVKETYSGCRITNDHPAWQEFLDRSPVRDDSVELIKLPFSFRDYVIPNEESDCCFQSAK